MENETSTTTTTVRDLFNIPRHSFILIYNIILLYNYIQVNSVVINNKENDIHERNTCFKLNNLFTPFMPEKEITFCTVIIPIYAIRFVKFCIIGIIYMFIIRSIYVFGFSGHSTDEKYGINIHIYIYIAYIYIHIYIFVRILLYALVFFLSSLKLLLYTFVCKCLYTQCCITI